MKYNGISLRRFKGGAYFPKGRRMPVWDSWRTEPFVRTVYNVLDEVMEAPFPVYTYDKEHGQSCWEFCAEFPNGVKA